MKKISLAILSSTISILLFGQPSTTKTEILSQQEISELFSDTSNNNFNFSYPIRRVYKCTHKYQNLYIVLTESKDSIILKDTLNRNIKALIFEERKNKLDLVWSINDFTVKRQGGILENTIWFWTKYCEFNDIDGDGLIDPLFIYGASGTYNVEDARIKFVIYYKKQKVVIQHQNSPVDYGRNMKIDAVFYTLPGKIQNHVKLIMKKMEANNHAIFPPNWQEEMKKKKLFFDEN